MATGPQKYKRTLTSSIASIGGFAFLPALILFFALPAEAHAQAATIVSMASSAIGDVLEAALGIVATFILSLSGVLLGIAGWVFNHAVAMTVFQYAQIFGNSQGVLDAWAVFRDIGNILLLFGFIFMGLLVIFDAHHYPVKKTLPAFIIFAVLLNFSLFAAEFVIDASNAMAAAVYNASGVCPEGATRQQCLQATDYGISGKVMEMAGVAGIMDVFRNAPGLIENGNVTLMLALLVTITAVVLFAGAILLIIRAIVLAFLMITSPVAFVGMAVPPLRGIASQWWSTLISQSFFAPVFLLLILVSLKIMEGVRVALNTGAPDRQGWATLGHAFNETGTSDITAFISFLLMIGFMIGSLLIAKKMGAMGAGFATNTASSFVFGTVTRGTNLAVGGGARAARLAIQRTVPNNKVGQVAVNRLIRPLENTNLDMRRIPGANGVFGAPAAHATYADLRHQYQDVREGKQGKELEQKFQSEVSRDALERTHGNLEGDANEANRRYLAGLSANDLKSLHGVEAYAKYLTTDQFTKLMDDKDVSDLTKSALADNRFKELAADVAAGNEGEIKKKLKGLSKDELVRLPAGILADEKVLNNLSDKQRDDLTGSNNRTDAEKEAVKRTTISARFEFNFNENLKAGPTALASFVRGKDGLSSLTPAQQAKLSNDILKNTEVAANLSAATLSKLQEGDKLSDADISTIAKIIRSNPSAKSYEYLKGPAGTYWQ